jgi:small redox-active disulfide protein 2
MKIQVLGSGCCTCKNLYELTKTAVSELGIDAEVEYFDDLTKVIELGVMESPVITIDGKIAMLGSGNLEKIKEVIIKNKDINNVEKKSSCSCGGKC